MSDFLEPRLKPDQREAVEHRGSPLLIVAGPGSGKTEVISSRARFLVRGCGVPPERMLVLTFTNRAAMELRDRIARKLGGCSQLGGMTVSTFHSFFLDVLREYPERADIPPSVRVLDGNGQNLFVYVNRKDLGLPGRLKGNEHRFIGDVVSFYNLMTEEMVPPGEVEDWCAEHCESCCEDELDLWGERRQVAESYSRYRRMLGEQGLLDFAHIQQRAVEMLEGNPKVLEDVRDRYREILVDEYQDTNAVQERLLSLLAGDGRRLTVVGDDDQSIYRFRGATVKNLLEFPQRYPDARRIELRHNFRSYEQIVSGGSRVISHNPRRLSKELRTVRGTGSDVVLVYGHSVRDEAAEVCGLLGRLHDRGIIPLWSDAAILLRSVASYAEPYLEELNRLGIPACVTGDRSFFEREEIARLYDLLNFLGTRKGWGDRFLRNDIVGLSGETRAALKAWKQPLFGLGGEELEEAVGVEDAEDRKRLEALLEHRRSVARSRKVSALRAVVGLLEALDLVGRLEREGRTGWLLNVGRLTGMAADWDRYAGRHSYYSFQRYMKMLRRSGVDPLLEEPDDAVQVMTIHQSKGLEFPVVVVGSAMEGRLPARKRSSRYDVPYRLRASGEPEVEDIHTVDERRLFYVAATRARDLLVVGTSDVVNKRGGGPSRFVREMFGEDLEDALEASRAKIGEIESRGTALSGPRPRVSFSGLAYYLQCPFRYKLARVYRVVVPWEAPSEFGGNVHRAMDRIHRRLMRGDSADDIDMAEVVADTWMPSPGLDEEREKHLRRAARRQIESYLQACGGYSERIAASETGFSFDMEGFVVTGRIDLVLQGPEGCEILDFKTGSPTELSRERVETQLDIYCLGAERSLGLDVHRSTVWFLRSGESVSIDWSGERRGRAEEGLKAMLRSIREGEFPPDRSYCGFCSEYRGLCPWADGGGS